MAFKGAIESEAEKIKYRGKIHFLWVLFDERYGIRKAGEVEQFL